MKANSSTFISGKDIILVPYSEIHVPKYHMWMQDVELQELTGSEPLTLEEEYEMQKSWLEDEKKCTFIVLDKEIFLKSKDEVESMIGDVNLFFNDQEDEKNAEVEVMIAETSHRGKGKGKEALLCMLRYGVETLGVNKFVAKIKIKNLVSQKMFQNVKFVEVKQIPVFQEVVLECEVNNTWKSNLLDITQFYHITPVLPFLQTFMTTSKLDQQDIIGD